MTIANLRVIDWGRVAFANILRGIGYVALIGETRSRELAAADQELRWQMRMLLREDQ